jgi:dolichyl-phosphate-mannose--protein O-mannosyl transferase
MAIIFFFGIFRRAKAIHEAKAAPEKKRTPAQEAAAGDGVGRLLITVSSCFLFFVAVPLGIYYLSYIPYFAPSGGVSVQKIIQAAEIMFSYHSEPGRGMEHYFYSPWYQWPVIGKPMWYAADNYEPAGYQSAIMAMGNPAVWWTGLVALFAVLCVWVRRHLRADRTFTLCTSRDDPRWALLIICFAAQYLPWILVPRGTYIYHYFPSIPFIILCTALCLDWLSEKYPRTARGLLVTLLCAAAVLFIAFFPYASGVAVPQKWLDAMSWFSNPQTGWKWLWY